MIVDGIVYIHSKDIVHFDLKLDNILVKVNNDGVVTDLCISDFDLSRSNRQFRTNTDNDGTKQYMAPEFFIKDNIFDKKVDSWSLGIILYGLLYKKLPFDG